MNLSELLPVRWFDGLVVNQWHLMHQDSSMRQLLAAVTRASVAQPGLLAVEAGRVRELRSGVILEDVPLGVRQERLTARVHLPALWVTPMGRLLVLASRGGGEGALVLDAPLKRVDRGAALLCIAESGAVDQATGTSRIEVGPEQHIEVQHPGLTASLRSPESYRERLQRGDADEVPIACLVQSGDAVSIDQDYVPPVTRLGLLAYFDATAVPELEKALRELLQSVSRHATYAAVSEQRDASSPLYFRQRAYESLRDILLARAGISADLRTSSPSTFVREVLQPVGAWWVHVLRPGLGDQLGERAKSVDVAAAGVQALRNEDFALGTSTLVSSAKQLLGGMNFVLSRVG